MDLSVVAVVATIAAGVSILVAVAAAPPPALTPLKAKFKKPYR